MNGVEPPSAASGEPEVTVVDAFKGRHGNHGEFAHDDTASASGESEAERPWDVIKPFFLVNVDEIENDAHLRAIQEAIKVLESVGTPVEGEPVAWEYSYDGSLTMLTADKERAQELIDAGVKVHPLSYTHPAEGEQIDVVAAVRRLPEPDGRYWLCRRNADGKHAGLAGMWEYPGGRVEEGEQLRAALLRELSEEFGGIGEPKVGAVLDSITYGPYRVTFFAVEMVEPDELRCHTEVRWMTPAEACAVEHLPSGTIFNARHLTHPAEGEGACLSDVELSHLTREQLEAALRIRNSEPEGAREAWNHINDALSWMGDDEDKARASLHQAIESLRTISEGAREALPRAQSEALIDDLLREHCDAMKDYYSPMSQACERACELRENVRAALASQPAATEERGEPNQIAETIAGLNAAALLIHDLAALVTQHAAPTSPEGETQEKTDDRS
ncbi:MAG: NUDIX domain-containing protein [Gemmatimonadota bacterium]